MKKISPYKLFKDYIKGTYRKGFTTLDQELMLSELATRGTIPAWLTGTLVRNGPAKFTHGESFVSNWFDGLGMLHMFSFAQGKVSYANKFIPSSDYEYVLKSGKMDYEGFSQDPCRSLFKRIFSLFMPEALLWPTIPNANVNILKIAEHFVAVTEIPLPVEFDRETLETFGLLEYKDNLSKVGIFESVHPHYDYLRKVSVNYLTKFSWKSTYNLYTIAQGSIERKVSAVIPADYPSYMHSFAMTQNYVILTEFPFRVNPLDLKLRVLKNKSFIHTFRWEPKQGTRFIVVDRTTGNVVGRYTTEAFFAFHHVNAFETEDGLIIDIISYDDPSIIGYGDLHAILAPEGFLSDLEKEKASSMLFRYTIDFSTNRIDSKPISHIIIELPRINYQRCSTKPYHYVYGVGRTFPGNGYNFDRLTKINVTNGSSVHWQEENCFPSEPVFVEAPNAQAEDDGLVLSVVLNATKENSFLLILNAQDFTELGRAEVPHYIPFGIHGNFWKL